MDLQPIAMDLSEANYMDGTVNSGTTYWYAVAAVTADGTETPPSEAVEVTPAPPPRVLEVQHTLPSRLEVRFDRAMHPASQDIHSYELSPAGMSDWVHPDSALLTHGETHVLLTFGPGELAPGREYELRIGRVFSRERVPFSDTEATFVVRIPSQEERNIRSLAAMVAYPNPVRPHRNHPGWVTFAPLPTDAVIRIYAADGALIHELEVRATDNHTRRWLLDNGREHVASGVYTYVVAWEDRTRTGQISVVR